MSFNAIKKIYMYQLFQLTPSKVIACLITCNTMNITTDKTKGTLINAPVSFGGSYAICDKKQPQALRPTRY